MTNCVRPPPRFPQPAAVALAVPTQFGANISEVWNCVMTNDAPIVPIKIRQIKNVAKLFESAIPITGSEHTSKRSVYVSRGPHRSHSQPTASRAMIVAATEPMMHQPTCVALNPISSRTTFIKGAIPNQEKKQTKNAIHDMWNARICGDEKFASSMRAALAERDSMVIGGYQV